MKDALTSQFSCTHPLPWLWGMIPVRKEGTWTCQPCYSPVLRYAGTYTAHQRQLTLLFTKNHQGDATNPLPRNTRLFPCFESGKMLSAWLEFFSASAFPTLLLFGGDITMCNYHQHHYHHHPHQSTYVLLISFHFNIVTPCHGLSLPPVTYAGFLVLIHLLASWHSTSWIWPYFLGFFFSFFLICKMVIRCFW